MAVIVALVLVVSALGKCSSTPSVPAAEPFGSPSLGNQISAIEPPPKVEPLSRSSVSRGIEHVRRAVAVEGLSGAMIYSQNCYDALSHAFSWNKLDTCGAFDMFAVRGASANDTGLENEARYFESEAAAQRYLAAATKAGEEASEADVRLEAVQSKVARAVLPKALAPPTTEETPAATPADDDSDNSSVPEPKQSAEETAPT